MKWVGRWTVCPEEILVSEERERDECVGWCRGHGQARAGQKPPEEESWKGQGIGSREESSAWHRGALIGGGLGNLLLSWAGEGEAGCGWKGEGEPHDQVETMPLALSGLASDSCCHLCLCLLGPPLSRPLWQCLLLLPHASTSSSHVSYQPEGFLDFHLDWTTEMMLWEDKQALPGLGHSSPHEASSHWSTSCPVPFLGSGLQGN